VKEHLQVDDGSDDVPGGTRIENLVDEAPEPLEAVVVVRLGRLAGQQWEQDRQGHRKNQQESWRTHHSSPLVV
jgi:hypothetical protein